MHSSNIEILKDTLKICDQGWYTSDGYCINLNLVKPKMKEAKVFLPEDIKRLEENPSTKYTIIAMHRNGHYCENTDSYSMAISVKEQYDEDVLVLNFANAVNPGGGVRRGAKAQEEDLCRRSSLLLSLESDEAKAYYSYNKSLKTYMGSDALILHPYVEIFKDEKGNCLEKSTIVSVLTCAAPMVTDGFEGLTQEEYEALLYNRIKGMLTVAAEYGYRHVVLGAWGCGAFANDAEVVAKTFYRVIKDFRYNKVGAASIFRAFYFAVLDHSKNQYNFSAFQKYFDGANFYKEEDDAEIQASLDKVKATELFLDKIKGSLIGGAAGDALGYPVEFMSENEIKAEFGTKGITEYRLDKKTGKALISDDTQMTLFTADGILVGETRIDMRGIGANPHDYVAMSYIDWLATQKVDYSSFKKKTDDYWCKSWLCDVPELFSRRAPGNTCLSALESDNQPSIECPVNDSKGCGGIMRVAPLGLHYNKHNMNVPIEVLDREGAEIAAITHGHSLGYMPAAVLTHILNRIVYREDSNQGLKDIILEANETINKIFKGDKHLIELDSIIKKAVALSENDDSDLNNIHKLGEGWVAEETLAIAIYCSLRYQNDFSSGIVAAVNHNGDSDSTGAVTGNILGALLGYEAIEDKWKENLELSDVIVEMAIDLCHGCQMSEYGRYRDMDWLRKYIDMAWKDTPAKIDPPIFFWKDNEKNGFLSNWYKSPFVIDDFEYLHVEQYIMAQKAKLFHDAKSYTAILRASSPWECKQLGRGVTGYIDSEWAKVREQVCKDAVYAKFRQNQELFDLLLDTGNAPLFEASPKDDLWGIGIDEATARQTDPAKWPGKSILGKVLMEVRAELGGADISQIINSSAFDMLNQALRDGLIE